MADETREIRARIDILDLVGQRVSLKRAGKVWKGLCPFHDDRNPSFTVSQETGRYKCWSCGEGGDIFNWVMKTQNVEFREALEILARAAGVTLESRGKKQDPSQRELWHTAMNEALAFFREQFEKSEQARSYCEGRSLSKQITDDWEIGYSPDAGDLLAVRLKRKGLPLNECKPLFLVDQDTSGGYFDRFRGRLMFPIRDERGELVAFGGRLLGDGQPKYINSGDTPIYRKSRVLYGLYRARDLLQKQRMAILVEGYLDVIACHRAGLSGALASLGTSLTEEHAKLLKRWCDEVTILYDSDEAGQKATRRAIEVLQADGLRVKVALMPPGDDPDTLLKAGGAGAVNRTIQQSVSPVEYEIHDLKRRLDPSTDLFWAEVNGALAKATNLEFEKLAPGLAGLYPGIRDPIVAMRALRRDVAKLKRSGQRPVAPSQRTAQLTSLSMALTGSELAVYSAILGGDHRAIAWQAIEEEALMETSTGEALCAAMRASFPSGPPSGPASEWLAAVEPAEILAILSDIEYDPRQMTISETLVQDTLEGLRRRKQSRERAAIKGSASTEEKNLLLQQISSEKTKKY